MKTLKLNRLLNNKKGISNVIGTMLLVVIVVIAVSGFAVVISGIQKNESDRLKNIAAVESEILKIMDINPVITGTSLDGLNFTLLNLNSRNARITAVFINGRAARNFTSTDINNAPDNFSFYNHLILMPGTSKKVSVDFKENFNPEYNLSITEPLEITVFTSYSNNFKRLFNPPKSVVKVSTETENIGAVERDVLILDGSDSYDDGSIISYRWFISNVSNGGGNITLAVSANCTNDSVAGWSYCCNYSYSSWDGGGCYNFTNGTYETHDITVWNYTESMRYNVTGKKVRLILTQSGPFYVTLTVKDDTNMIGVSEEITIQKNNNFNPAVISTPPMPVIKVSIETENIGSVERDVLVLDGSDSYDDGSVISYEWLISNGTNRTNIAVANCTYNISGAGNLSHCCNDTYINWSSYCEDITGNYTIQNITVWNYTESILHNVAGKKVRLTFNQFNQSGPFYVNLTVKDDTNRIGISRITIPRDNNFNPAVISTPSTPPVPVIKVSTETEKIGAIERDVLVLDGSDSYDDGSVISYEWLISNGTNRTNIAVANCTYNISGAGNLSHCCNDTYINWSSYCEDITGNYTIQNITVWNYTEGILHNVAGKKVRLTFNQFNQSGPFYVNLTVKDDTNRTGISRITIPQNNNFNPAVISTPPTPVIKVSTETENLGAGERDVLVLDGSDSYADGSITGYGWIIKNSACDLLQNVTGKKVRLRFNQSGPFNVTLTVKDNTGQSGVSEITIPENMNFNPNAVPPMPVIKISIETENLGVAYRDVLVLDGSDSYDDDGSVIGYGWLVKNSTGEILHNVTGKKVRVILSQSGPFNVNLTVKDNTGVDNSKEITIPENRNFNPPVTMSVSYSSTEVNVTVNDINSKPLGGVGVYFIRISGNVTFTPSSSITNSSSGMVSTNITGGEGIIRARSGDLSSADISVP